MVRPNSKSVLKKHDEIQFEILFTVNSEVLLTLPENTSSESFNFMCLNF